MRAIVGASLIDGTGSPPVPDSAVLVGDDGRIEAAGQRQEIALPPDIEVLQTDGLTLLPGLIDCHDHLSSFSYDLMDRWGLTEPRSLRYVRIARVMEETLLTGYTPSGTAAGARKEITPANLPSPQSPASRTPPL